jgi:hypothetical protein
MDSQKIIPHLTDKNEVTSASIVPPLPISTAPQMSEEHMRQLAEARVGAKKVRRAIAVANFDGWSIGAFGALTLLFGITDPSSIVMGLGMATIAWIELRGAGALKRLDPRAARTLGLNQLALASLLIVYALWRLYGVMTGAGPYDAIKASDAGLAPMLKPIEDITRMVSLALYGSLIVIAVFAQGGMAWYYFSRAKHIASYVLRTPPWIVKLQQSGIAL